MSENELLGRPVEEVVAAVAAEDGPDSDHVREALDPVVADGRVTQEAVETAVTDTAMVVSTAETRTERAGHAFADAREAAAPVVDVDTVAARLDRYADRLAGVEERSANLMDDLARPVERLAGDEVYELAVEVREVASHAQGVVRTADDLAFDLGGFESWLGSPSRRHDEFADDIDLLEGSLADLETVADAVPDGDNPAAEWADATMRARVLDLLVRDLAAELDDLRVLAGEAKTVPAELTERVRAIDERTDALAGRLADAAEPEYHERYGDDVDDLAAALAAFETPVDWAAVEGALMEHRAASDEDA